MYSDEIIRREYKLVSDRLVTDRLEDTLLYLDRECPPRPMITFAAKEQKTDVFDSKIGGMPYMPVNEICGDIIPEYKDKKLAFVAQLNLEKLPPMEGLPDKGILQFYMCDDDIADRYDSNWNDRSVFSVLYHRNIITERSKLLSEFSKWDKFHSCCFAQREALLIPKRNLLCPMPVDYHDLDRLLQRHFHCSDEGEYSNEFTDFCDAVDELGIRRNYTTCVGGYASSYGCSDYISDFQLLQLADKEKNSIVHFSINRDRLAAWDFSRAECSVSRKNR